MHLSKRLANLAQYVPAGKNVADIGTDHGYLPIFLATAGIAPRIIASDINPKPLASARDNIASYKLKNIDLRLGNGLAVLTPGEVEVIILAGMGGGTMQRILEAEPLVLDGLERLILQPMGDEKELRRWLIDHGWRISDENLLEEDGRIYLIIMAERGRENMPDQFLLEVGPRLLEKNHPLLDKHIARLEEKYLKVLTGLQVSSRPESRRKAKCIEEVLERIKEVRACQLPVRH